jgi:hypothetical protein
LRRVAGHPASTSGARKSAREVICGEIDETRAEATVMELVVN